MIQRFRPATQMALKSSSERLKTAGVVSDFGLRRQSAAATALSDGVVRLIVQSVSQSGVALRLPPQSKFVRCGSKSSSGFGRQHKWR